MTATQETAALTPLELARWAWRQLTSMRTALLLLLLLALASVPGSVVPQASIAPLDVSQWRADHPGLAPVYDALGLFHVYTSVWFSAVYLLLMVSLVGCILPRLRVYWRALRAKPPAAPRNLSRLPAYARTVVDHDVDQVLRAAGSRMRQGRYRVRETDDAVAAERGHLREAGNLVFHVSVLVTLVGFAYGQLFGYTGGAIVLVGKGFSNIPSQYDEFAPGSLLDPESLAKLSFDVQDFEVSYHFTGPAAGTPSDFEAELAYREGGPGAPEHHHTLKVNHPLTLDGVDVFLVGNGYAPVFTITDGDGDSVTSPAVFLPTDGSYRSFGVVKASDASPTQLGFEGEFYPTYEFTPKTGPYSSFPDALAPRVSLTAYAGDLGMDTGRAQNVFVLDKSKAQQVMKPGKQGSKLPGDVLRLDLEPGQTQTLPDGLGSIEFTGWQRWVKLQISDSPGEGIALGGVLAGIAGLMASLFIRPRRVWVRARREGGRTVVEVAGLDRSSSGEGLDDEVARLSRRLTGTSEEAGP